MSAKKKSGNGQWKTVIVEDSPTQAEQLKYILETHGYQVVAASNGKEALALVRAEKPNIVISDIVMPEMDGYELCKQIKCDEKLRDVPVMLLTALSDSADVIKGLACGADNFVTKPFDERALISRIEYLRRNWRLPDSKRAQVGVEITFSGRKYFITSGRLQILNLLISTYDSAVSKHRELVQAQDELRRLNEQLEQNVRQRVKELRCVYNIDILGARHELTLDEICQEVVNMLPQGWQYPEIVGAKLTLRGENFETKNYKDTEWQQSSGIQTCEGKVGEVKIVYLEEKPELDEGPFVKEERGLINSVAEHLARIIESKQAEEARIKMLEYDEMNKLKTNLLSIVSHELRTPLTTIKGYSTMLLDYDRRLKHYEKQEYLSAIDRATDRMTELVEHLLDMSRLDAGLLKLDKTPTNITVLLQTTIAEARLRTPGHKIVLNLPKTALKLNGDGRRIRQVVDNLIDNATKYSEVGSTVTIEARGQDSELVTSVADRGIGIPRESLGKVFDRMFNLEHRLAQDPSGLGLGLALCKALVEAHGGRIWMESEEGKGSTCFFTLPLDTKGDSHNEGV
jgi:signal transduction histidine kinase/DNA-binding response OmpR family regulator